MKQSGQKTRPTGIKEKSAMQWAGVFDVACVEVIVVITGYIESQLLIHTELRA
jgi:hypothetical protein